MQDFHTFLGYSRSFNLFFFFFSSISVEIAHKESSTIIIIFAILKFIVRRWMLKSLSTDKFLWKVPDNYWAITQAATNYIQPWYRTVWNDCVLKASLQRKVFRKFLKVFHLRGRTSLKDANVNCTWLNENRKAEDSDGKILGH